MTVAFACRLPFTAMASMLSLDLTLKARSYRHILRLVLPTVNGQQNLRKIAYDRTQVNKSLMVVKWGVESVGSHRWGLHVKQAGVETLQVPGLNPAPPQCRGWSGSWRIISRGGCRCEPLWSGYKSHVSLSYYVVPRGPLGSWKG